MHVQLSSCNYKIPEKLKNTADTSHSSLEGHAFQILLILNASSSTEQGPHCMFTKNMSYKKSLICTAYIKW